MIILDLLRFFFEQDQSIALWFYVRSLDPDPDNVIIENSDDSRVADYGIYALYESDDPDNFQVYYFLRNDSGVAHYFVHDSDYDFNRWYHVVATYDGGHAKLYVNGQLVFSEKAAMTLRQNAVLLGVGDDAPGGDANLDGMIDDVRIYDKALSESEVQDLYQRCEVPFFWQRDPNGINDHPLRGTCGTNFDTIGEGGCTLTSATMLFRYYGSEITTNNLEMTPPNLSDCMNSKACPFHWLKGATCSEGSASNPRRDINFSYSKLDQELNQNHRPVILQMCRPKGACNWEGPITHWVLVVGGEGTDPAGYTIWDPWFECGQNMRLNSRSETWDFVGMTVYDGTPTCSFSTEAHVGK